MSFKIFKEFLSESQKSEGLRLTEEDLEKLEKEVPFLVKMREAFQGEPKINSFPPGLSEEETGKMKFSSPLGKTRSGFLFFPRLSDGRNFGVSFIGYQSPTQKSLANGLKETMKKFEEDGQCWIVPNLFEEKLTLVFDHDPELEPGSFRKKRIYDWADDGRIAFSYNANTFNQVKSVIQKSIVDFLDFAKGARIVLKWEALKKKKDLSKKVVAELQKVYQGLVDEFLQKANLDPDLVEDDLFGLALLKSVKNSKEDQDFINDLPPQALRTWLKFGTTNSSGNDKPKIDDDFIESMEKLYNMKPLWNLI